MRLLCAPFASRASKGRRVAGTVMTDNRPPAPEQDYGRRRGCAAPRKLLGQLGNGGADQPLVGTTEGFGEQRRGIRREAVLDQFCDKRRKGAPAHIDHGGRFGIRQRRPVQVLRQLAGDIGPGHELDAARGWRRVRECRPARRRHRPSDSGNDLAADAGFAQRLQLLFEPAKDTGIARLQPHLATPAAA